MAEKIHCKKCGEIVEFAPGIHLDPIFINEYEKDSPKYTACYKCRKKWAEKNLKCKECGKKISMHDYVCHGGFCELHYNLAQDDYNEIEDESKIRNLKDDELPSEIKDSPIFEEEYCDRGYACKLGKDHSPLEDENGEVLFRKLSDSSHK